MAKRMLLVDENMYKGLLNATVRQTPAIINNNDENVKATNLNFIKKELIKNKKKPSKRIKDLRGKNLQLNNYLKRYLKLRRERQNKPIKVEIEKGANLLVKPNTKEATTVTEDGNIGDPLFFSTPLQHKTVKFAPFSKKSPISPFIKTGFEASDDQDYEEDGEETFRQHSKRSRRRVKKNKENESEADEAYRYIIQHSQKFGVTEDGKVMGPKKVIANSYLKESLYRIFNPKSHNNYSPPGTSKIRKKVLSNSFLKELLNKSTTIDSFESAQEGKGKFIFKPLKLKKL